MDKEDLFHHYKQMEVRKLFCSLRAVLSSMLVQGKKMWWLTELFMKDLKKQTGVTIIILLHYFILNKRKLYPDQI